MFIVSKCSEVEVGLDATELGDGVLIVEGQGDGVVARWGEAWNEPGDGVLHDFILFVVLDSGELLLVKGSLVPLAVGPDGVEITVISEDTLENEVNVGALYWHEGV